MATRKKCSRTDSFFPSNSLRQQNAHCLVTPNHVPPCFSISSGEDLVVIRPIVSFRCRPIEEFVSISGNNQRIVPISSVSQQDDAHNEGSSEFEVSLAIVFAVTGLECTNVIAIEEILGGEKCNPLRSDLLELRRFHQFSKSRPPALTKRTVCRYNSLLTHNL